MQLLKKQIEYYNNLSDFNKKIYKAFAIKTTFSSATDLSNLLNRKDKYTASVVNDTIKEAIKLEIIDLNVDAISSSSGNYYMTYSFLAYIITLFTEEEKRELRLENRYFRHGGYFNGVNPKDVAFLLFNILYDNPEPESYVNRMIFNNYFILTKLDLMSKPQYLNNLNKLNSESLFSILSAQTSNYIDNLKPISLIDKSLNLLSSQIDSNQIDNFNGAMLTHKYIFMGNFNRLKDILVEDSEMGIVINAIVNFLEGNINESIKLFDRRLRLLKHEHRNKNIMIIPDYRFNYFYFTLLLSLPTDKALPRAKKILDSFSKMEYDSEIDDLFKYIIKDTLGIKSDNNHYCNNLYKNIFSGNKLMSLIKIMFANIANIAPPASMRDSIFKLVKQAYDNEHYLVGYEVSYALTKWFGDEGCIELFNKFESKMNYKPASSFIQRVDEWEKSLDLMTGVLGGVGKENINSKQNTSTHRIVYTFDYEYYDFKPILQTKGSGGKWSKGRGVSLKSFQEGNTKGMTDRDLRISKYVRSFRFGSSDSYELSALVAQELIGYPLVFMADNIEIPIELIESKPIIKVERRKNGYVIESDISDHNRELIIEKETNTRFKVYRIENKVQELLRIINTSKIVIPEAGVEKLILLLGEISRHAVVQSNLISSENGGIGVKEVETDSRIRIQLLPIGDGLKAELFVKPFDKVPPYSKPASGGNVLLTNLDGEQVQVKRDFDVERENYYTILDNIQSLEGVDTSDNLISFENPLDSLFLLDVISDHQDISVVEWPEGENFKITSRADFSNLKMRIKSKTNWFELDGELVIDENNVISMHKLLDLMTNSHDRFIELNKGEFIALSEKLRRRLSELSSYTENKKSGVRINKYATLALDGFFENLDNIKADKSWREFRKRLESKSITDAEIPNNLQAELRPYQEEGFKWMTRLSEMGAGACLADDMGLGKTLQTIAVLLSRVDKGPSLVVCPVSIIGNWFAEAQRFAPLLNVKILNNVDRDATIKELSEGDVLITSYGLLQSEEELFAKKEFGTIVLDEAHIIKNYATKTSKAIMKLKGEFRIALTGTPLQNHMGEIWNLFNFINPGLLGNLKHFTDTFIKPDNEDARTMLRKLIRPFILRRSKSAVLEELPPKTEIIKKIQLSDTEMAFYEALRRQALINIESDEDKPGAKHIKALAEITKLRQASCNPLLVDPNINIESSKLNAFLEIIEELQDNKHRALVFSQFVTHLSIVRKALDDKGIKYQYLDGSSPMKEREKSVRDFQRGKGDLFLISLKAGGLGLNLTAADFVIHLDPWWNPAIEDQASDRAHRFGQKRPVTIYRLVAENTIEEKIIKLHHSKRDLAESLLEGSDQSAKMSFIELVELMKG